MSKNQFRGIASTTHVDRHGDRVTRELLEHQVEVFKKEGKPFWGYWNHLTTLPPLTIVTDQEVEKREDGEYQLVVKGELLRTEDFENIFTTEIKIPQITAEDISTTIINFRSKDLGELYIRYDPRYFDPNEIEPEIEKISELIPAKQGYYIRKAELSQAVIFVLLAYATGFIARFGEVTAEKVIEKVPSFRDEFVNRFAQILDKSKSDDKPDLIIGVQIQNTNIVVEGAVEEVDSKIIKDVWKKLPELYCFAEKIITRNKQDYFSEIKFLFNPETRNWEINYLLTRNTNRVVLGPRYYDPSHPLKKRWEDERENFKSEVQDGLGMSLGFIPTEFE